MNLRKLVLGVNKWLLVSIVLALLLLLQFTCKREPEKVLIPGKTEVRWLNDSTKYYQQNAAIADAIGQIKSLQDSLERAVSKNANTNPSTIIRLTEKINYDSLYIAYTNPLKDSVMKYKDLSDSAFKKQTLAKFEYKDKWMYQKGRVLGGGIAIDSLSITAKSHIIVSETKGFLKPKKIVVQVINENPNVDYGEIQSYVYKPKKKPIGLTVGPTLMYNGQFRVGIGITYGLRL